MIKRSYLYAAAATLVLANLVVAVSRTFHPSSCVQTLGTAYRVAGIRVLDDDLYEVRYYDGDSEKCSLVRLPVRARQGSKNKIINFLNKVERPRLVALSRTQECIIGDFVFAFRGSDMKFSEWLQSNRLSYG